MKKFLSIFLACLMVFGLTTAALFTVASAANIVETGSLGETVFYTLDDEGVMTVSGTGEMTFDFVEDYDNEWTFCDKYITKVIIEPTITAVNYGAFCWTENLVSVEFRGTADSASEEPLEIGEYAFACCQNLSEVIISRNIVSMGEYVFYDCADTLNVTFTDGVTGICQGAFCYNESIKSIVIPASVEAVYESAFYGCRNLSDVTIQGNTVIEEFAFTDCADTLNVTFADTVTEIKAGAFWDNESIKSIIIPASVEAVRESAFCNCKNLSDITIQGNTVIEEFAFGDCADTLNVTFADTVTEITAGAFWDNESIKSIVIPASVETVRESAFYGCRNLSDVTIQGNTVIEEFAFGECADTLNVTFANTVTEIQEGAFFNCDALKSVVIPANVRKINFAFYDCENLETIYFLGSQAQWEAIDMESGDRARLNEKLVLDYSAPVTYTVTWKNWDGTVLQTAAVEAGTLPQYNGEVPSRPGDAFQTYVFTGWSPDVAAITQDTELVACFAVLAKSYTVTFTDATGEILRVYTVTAGATPSYDGEIPTRSDDDFYTYVFTGWSPSVGAITQDTTFTPCFVAQMKQIAPENPEENPGGGSDSPSSPSPFQGIINFLQKIVDFFRNLFR